MGKKNFALLIYADWCPHCINLKPDWNEAASKSKCNIVQVNDDMFNKLRHGIDTEYKDYMFPSVLSAPFHGFPSIRMVNTTGEKGVIGVKEYDNSNRDVSSLSAFFKDIYNSSSPVSTVAATSKSKKYYKPKDKKPNTKNPKKPVKSNPVAKVKKTVKSNPVAKVKKPVKSKPVANVKKEVESNPVAKVKKAVKSKK
jgi:thiol-disulfide isomerase/thioredoxin